MSFARGTTFANRLSGGGNPTGYSESGGVVTLSNSVVIDAGAIETALAAATADGTLAISDPNGVAHGRLDLQNAAGTTPVGFSNNNAGGINVLSNGVTRYEFVGSSLFRSSAGNYAALGNASAPWGAVSVGDAANEGSTQKGWHTTLTDATATNLVTIACADNEYVGGVLEVAIYATDGTDDQIRVETVRFAAYNIGGTITVDISPTATADDALAVSTGTLTATYDSTTTTTALTLRITATSSLTTTSLVARVHGTFLAAAQTVTPA